MEGEKNLRKLLAPSLGKEVTSVWRRERERNNGRTSAKREAALSLRQCWADGWGP